MMKMFISLMMIFFSFFMIFINHPLSMGFMILIQTLLTCIISGMIIKTYWFSYILFLTFLGGLLVLFIYVSSIASNEMFFSSMYLKLYSIFSFMIISIFSINYMYNINWMNFINNSDMETFFNNFNFIFFNNNEIKINLSKLYNNQTFILMMMLIIYLFITLIAVVKITNIFYGPLRSSN